VKPPKASKEQQLLFKLLEGDPPTSLKGIDTKILFDLFRRHRLFPIATDVLPLLEGEEQERWKQAIRKGSLESLRFVSRLSEIIDRFISEGIEVRPLKGPVLAQTLYGDISQRHMRDLDLLVSREDLMKAMKTLQDMGYVLKFPGRELTARQWNIYLRQQYDVAMVHREDGSLLELHTQISYPGLLGGLEHLITHEVEPTEIASRTVNALSKEGNFLYLAIHGAHHLFFRLFWLRDLSESLKRWDLDHKRIVVMAQQMGIEAMLGVGLRLAECYFETSIPASYLPLLREHQQRIIRMEERCHRAIFEPRFYSRRSRANVLRFYMDLKPGYLHKWHTMTSVYHRWRVRTFLVR